MPDEEMGKNHRVIGDFVPGVNAPEDVKELSKAYLNPARTHQVEIIVKRSNEIQQTLTYVKYRYCWLCNIQPTFCYVT